MRIFTLLILLSLFSIFSTAQTGDNHFEDITAAIKAGSSREVSRYLNSSVELTVGNKDNICSKVQAEIILREFFASNHPVSFSIIHQGASAKCSRYAIGRLVTSGGNYRTYIFIKEMSGQNLIQELRFEKE